MESVQNFTEAEFYEATFDSRAYIDTFYSHPGGHEGENYLLFVLQQLSGTFCSGKYKGQRLVEVGSAASIHCVISACAHFDQIIMSDFAESNRQELSRWLRKEPGCFDWGPVIRQVGQMESGRNPVQVEDLLRARVKSVVKCDVRLENPFHPSTLEPADCVITSLCLEAACKDLPSYRASLGNVTSVLRPGGALVITGALGETFYIVAGQRFSCLHLTSDDVKKALEDLQFSIVEFNILKWDSEQVNHVSDFDAMFYCVAVKSI
ncbi:nicotinamide N-methyltransferase [Engraulis encrasicolus]|uniref:nicotinamide N-methyltransferase n=1 Tax=Engraulis encrasicolus TaxID=184585 RepID=UPI002FD6533C